MTSNIMTIFTISVTKQIQALSPNDNRSLTHTHLQKKNKKHTTQAMIDGKERNRQNKLRLLSS